MAITQQNFFKNFILGVTNECIKIDSRQLNDDAILKLTSSAHEHVLILSRNLDPSIFNQQAFMDVASEMARRKRSSYIHILVNNPASMIKQGSRIVELCQRISSKVEIRTICDEHSQFNRSFLIADSIGYLHNAKSDLYDAEVNFNDKEMSNELTEIFNKIWEQSIQDTAIRRLCI